MAPETYERLDARGYADRMGVSLRTAYRLLERLRARQSEPEVLRLEIEAVRLGKGAVGERMVVLWPRLQRAVANDNAR